VVAASVAALLGAALGPTPAAQAVTSTSSLSMVAGADSPGGAFQYTDAALNTYAMFSEFGVFAQAYDSATGRLIYLDFMSPQGSPIAAGTTYVGAGAYPPAAAPTMVLTVNGTVCPKETYAAFRVLELERDPVTLGLTRFAAVFDYHCSGALVGAQGSFFWNSTLGPRPRTSWVMSGSTLERPGTAVTAAGSLRDADGAAMSGRAVTVHATAIGSAPVVQGATTDVTGSVAGGGTLGLDSLQIAVEYAGDATHEPSIASRTILVDRRASTLTGSLPAPLYAGSSVQLTGKLTDTAGPIAGAQLKQGRPVQPETIAVATTGADGTYAFPLTLDPSAGGTYLVSFVGNTDSAPASVAVYANVLLRPSTMTLSVPPTATRAKPYLVKGTLRGLNSAPLVGAEISYTRKDLAGTTHGVATTGADGSFSIADTPTVGGSVAWTVTYVGSETQNYATKTATVSVSRLATLLTISVVDKIFAYGTTARVTVHLGTTYTGRKVRITAHRATNPTDRNVLAAGQVDAQGNLSTTFKMLANTTITAEFPGDYRYAPARVTIKRSVHYNVTVTPIGWYTKVGATSVYRVGKTPAFGVKVVPGNPGGCVAVVAQRLTSGVWKTVAAASCIPLASTTAAASTVFLSLTGNSKAGRMRIAAAAPANSGMARGISPWAYYSFN
jgi:hypothetical protein